MILVHTGARTAAALAVALAMAAPASALSPIAKCTATGALGGKPLKGAVVGAAAGAVVGIVREKNKKKK